MNNRFGPPSRDRSPSRYDRRPSTTTHPSAGSSYRGPTDSNHPSDRGPPVGPKAEGFGGSRFPFSPSARGRGGNTFSSRPPIYDRDRDRDRDSRSAQSYRSRDDDRPEWSRRERDLAPGDRGARAYSARDRSASPLRVRRDSRESLPPLSTRPSDTSSYYTPAARGALGRGRGRADYERARGRNSFAGDRDRDLFSNRSNSRDGWRGDRDFDKARPPVSDREHRDRYDRRDHERSRERDVRSEHDTWPRDPSPSRAPTGASVGRGVSPVTATPTNASPYAAPDKSSKMEYELARRASAVVTPASVGRDRRDLDQSDYFTSRSDPPRRDGPSAPYQTATAQTPAAAAGLDYGPPPAIPAPSSEKPVTSKAPATSGAGPASMSSAFQPPSGPKAERIPSASLTTPSVKAITQQEPFSKIDVSARPSRPLPAGPGPGAASTESLSKLVESKHAMPQTPDKSLPANVPIGPRSTFGPGFKPRQPSSEPVSTTAPVSKAMPSDHRSVVVPKGPRYPEGGWSSVGHISRSQTTWVSPEYSRSKPSIMNPLGRDRPSFAPPSGPRSQTILPPHNEKPRIFPHPSSQVAGATSTSPRGLVQKPTMSPAQAFARSPGARSVSEDVEMSLRDSSEDSDDIDEDDYTASEEKHLQERIQLEARKPPPLLQDSSVRNLLIRIQFLNMIMHEVIPKPLVTADTTDDKIKAVEPTSIGLPSPEEMSEEREEKPELKHPQPRGRPLSQPAVNPIPTPPIEDLPYRIKQSPKFIMFDESDDEVQHEAITTLIRQEFESAAFDWQDELQELHTNFRHKYPQWKQDIAMLDSERRELQPSPAPASPAPSAAPSVTPSLGHDRTRVARNATEADLQQAILMSQQSLKEEEERREREAASNSQPNYDTEAVVPAMMKPSEIELTFFDDTNKLIPTNLALDTFAYVPPEDDFTAEEQLAFIDAYCTHPKKWGKIAESLPSRSYRDCITHYYLTKNDAKYKIIWRNSQPKRKRGRAATKPRSTALMSELVYDNDGDVAVAVTDTGRPRRAAAPTFGDAPGDSDIATPIPQAKRLAMTKEPNGELVNPKPGRGRKAGGIAKPRRTKAQIQADQQAASLLPALGSDGSPQKVMAPARERARTLLRAENGSVKTDFIASPDLSRTHEVDVGTYHPTETDRLPHAIVQSATNQPTSYWSVPEQQKFPQLIAYYGKDFTSIADFMKTKTATMIKNHYNRQIHEGKSDLEDLARVADRRRADGEPMGAPPSPAAQTKRRYEATPSTASISRPAILQPERSISEAEQSSLTAKSIYTDDFPSNAVQRGTSGVDLIARPRPARDILREAQPVAPSQAKIEDFQRSQLFGPKPLTGPRSGFFKEESHGFGLPHHFMHEQSPHQHPVRSGELRIGEPQQQNLLGPPREPIAAPHASIGSNLGASPVDKYGQSVQQRHHGRSGSLGMVSPHPTLQDAKDPTSLRRLESNPRQSTYSLAPTQPPASTIVQGGILGRSDTGSTGPTAPEQPKPAPAKRSNLMNLLNADPPEPQPPKRTSLESQSRPSMLSPQPVPVTSQSLSFEAARAHARPEDLHGIHRSMRATLGQPPASQLGNLSLRDSQPGFPVSQADQNNERWMDRFDPRPQSGPNEQRSLHQSPRVGGYSVVPPSTTPHPSQGQSVRMEAQRSMDAGPTDHRRLLTQMNHPGSNPSPPPQQAPQSIPPYRSLSGSSHHGRFGSTGFQQSQPLSHSSPHMHPVQQPPGQLSHPPSASSTPVSSLHHQNRPSLDYQPPRLTIQQYVAQHQQQHVHHREREHEDALRRQREAEAQPQQMRMPERDRDHQIRHRDLLGFGSVGPHHESQSQSQSQSQPQQAHPHQPQHSSHSHNQHLHQQHPQIMAGIPGGRPLGFGGPHAQQQQQSHEPVTRTYTPPGAPLGAGTSSGMLGHAHAPHHGQHQHQHQPHHQHHGSQQMQHQLQHQHQHHQQQQQQGGGPGPGLGQQQHQQGFGGHHTHSHGHFRGLSQQGVAQALREGQREGARQGQGQSQMRDQGQAQGDGREERR